MNRSTDRYQLLGTLYESARTVVYRAHRMEDERAVILKLLKPELAGPRNLRRLHNEYRLLGELEDLPVIRALGCEEFGGSQMLVLEDIGGRSLDALPHGKPLAPDIFLPLAIRIVEAVRALHHRDIVHRDLQPANIVITPPTLESATTPWDVRLIDFDTANELPREEIRLHPSTQIDGALPYLAPEQSGRMNRVIDFRADYYSLGVSFFQLLTGRLPFDAADAPGWLHCHIAVTPPAPHEVEPGVPEALSRIVLRLMAKNPEDRYQSGTGLLLDLQECLQHDAGRGLRSDFVPGQSDSPEELRVPQRLYGRDREVDALKAAFAQARSGNVELALVGGAPGSGKTALIHHVINLGADQPDYVLEGKFDQYQRDVPYAGWVQAFNRILQFWMSESPERVEMWRRRIRDALGDSAGILTSVLPSAEWLLGKQPLPYGSAGDTAQRQFDYVFGQFVKSVSCREHPLVVFLDDLQWADAASIRLLDSLFRDPDLEHFILVGAYRRDEVDEGHLLNRACSRLEADGLRPLYIDLDGLRPEDISRLLADTLRASTGKVELLATMLCDASDGNPFDIGRLLESLQERDVVRFDAVGRCWEWDPDLLQDALSPGVSGRLVSSDTLDGLSPQSLEVVQVAACLGNRFDSSVLAQVLGREEESVIKALTEAVDEDLVLPVDGSYRFVHDRVRQAAYDSMDASEQRGWHLRIGRTLLDREGHEKLFDVVNQLNRAIDEFLEGQQRQQLVALNLEASSRAREGAAYAEALLFAQTAMKLLPENAWQRDPEQAYALYRQLAELQYLNHAFEPAETVIRDMLEWPLSNLQRAETLALLVTLNTMRASYDEALALSREALELLNIDLPHEGVTSACEALIGDILESIAELTPGALARMEDMPCPEMRMAAHMLATLAPITYFVDQSLYPYVVGRLTELSIRHGPTRDTAFGYASFGLILASRKQFSRAYLFGEAAEALGERFRDPGQQCKALQIVANHVKLWGAPIAEADALNERVYRLGLESGEHQFAGYSRNNHVLNGFFMGVGLHGLDERMEEYLAFCRRTGNVIAEDTINSVRLPARNLMSLTRQDHDFHDERFPDSDSFVSECQEHSSNYALCSFLTHKAIVFYLYEDFDSAHQCLVEAEPYLAYMPASIAVVQWHLFNGLVNAALAQPGDEQALGVVQAERDELALLAKEIPDNFLHLQRLLEAEIARIQGRMWQAMGLYDEATQSAVDSGFHHHGAMANELAGRFWLQAGKRQQARMHLDAAYDGYRRWGALRKANRLRRRYLDLWLEGGRESNHLLHDEDTAHLDWVALLKSSQAMAGEMRMDRLMSTIMEVVIENAGAERGLLVLCHDEKWWVEAEGGRDATGMLLSPQPLEECDHVSQGIVYYVVRTGEDVVLGDAAQEGQFIRDPYVRAKQLRSVLCTPLVHKGDVLGVLYLENRLTSHAFSAERLAVLKVLTGQAVIALQNARLYADLELRVKDRTRQLEQLNARLETLASTDHLTGVMNRRRFQERIQLLLAHARRYDTSVALLLFDVDHFKAVNDRFGHAVGDRVLQEITTRVQGMLRETDVLARWGGEEFIVLTEHADLAAAGALAERLRGVIAGKPFTDVGQLTASFGVACSRGTGTPEDLIGAADRALYTAKGAGRNCVQVWDDNPPTDELSN